MLLASFTIRPLSALLRHARQAVARAARGVKRAGTVWQHRREVARLSEMSAHELKDIGLSRSDVLGALEGHWLDDPSLVLAARSDDMHSAAAGRRDHVLHPSASMRAGDGGTPQLSNTCVPRCT